MRLVAWICAICLGWACALATPGIAQLAPYPQPSNLPPAVLRDSPSTPRIGEMVPFNPATNRGIFPATTPGSPLFDPYTTRPNYQSYQIQKHGTTYTPPYGSIAPYNNGQLPSTSPGGMFGNPNAFGNAPYSGQPGMPGTTMPGAVYPNPGLPSTSYPAGGYPAGGYPTTLNPVSLGLVRADRLAITTA